jgi:cytochrome P450
MSAPAAVDVLERLTSTDFRRDPYPFLRWLREQEPVHLTKQGYYMVSRHRDADRVLRDHDTFRTPDRDRLAEQFPEAADSRTAVLLLNSLPSLNAPQHTRIRRIVARDFTPKAVTNLHARIEKICDAALDRIAEPLNRGEEVDLHTDFTLPYVREVVTEVLGLPFEEGARVAVPPSELAAALGSKSVALLIEADGHTALQEEFFREIIARRRRDPRDDLVTALVGRRDAADDERLSDDELVAMMWVLWNVACEGTASSIELGLRTLIEHPEQGRWLDADRQAALAFADEVVRRTGPQIFLGVSKIAARDVELSGVQVPAGSQLRPVMAAANRDPEAFEDPDRFDPSRDNAKSLVWGQGAHTCLGSFLARAEIATALAALRRRLPALAMAGEPTWSRHSYTLRAAERFPVVLAGCGRADRKPRRTKNRAERIPTAGAIS